MVEDDDSLRALTAELLTSQGYEVLSAKNGKSALNVAREYPRSIHLLLTDIVMPEMNGLELAKHLKTVRSGISVLYMSGYAGKLLSENGAVGAEISLLSKPFTKRDLLASVEASLYSHRLKIDDLAP